MQKIKTIFCICLFADNCFAQQGPGTNAASSGICPFGMRRIGVQNNGNGSASGCFPFFRRIFAQQEAGYVRAQQQQEAQPPHPPLTRRHKKAH